jgi:hypothetical protein
VKRWVKRERLARLNAEVKAQEVKYDEALGKVPNVALMQIDRKLTRLMEERNELSEEIRYGKGEG